MTNHSGSLPDYRHNDHGIQPLELYHGDELSLMASRDHVYTLRCLMTIARACNAQMRLLRGSVQQLREDSRLPNKVSSI